MPSAPFSADGAARSARRFTLEVRDLGLPCEFSCSGTLESVLDAGVWHARHVHKLRGSVASLRATIKSAIREYPHADGEVPEARGRRSESYASDEAANMTRGSAFDGSPRAAVSPSARR